MSQHEGSPEESWGFEGAQRECKESNKTPRRKSEKERRRKKRKREERVGLFMDVSSLVSFRAVRIEEERC